MSEPPARHQGALGRRRQHPGRTRIRHLLAWHRRTIAAVLAAASVAVALLATRPAPPPAVATLVAAHDLDGGAVLSSDDLRRVDMPPDLVPEGAFGSDASLSGRVVAGPVRSGEPVTDVRLVGPGLLAAYENDGLVAAPVRLADPNSVELLRPGDLVDVLATPAELSDVAGTASGVAHTVAPEVRVVTVPGARASPALVGAGGESGALVVLATTPAVAASLARASTDSRLSIVLRAG